VDDEVTVVRIYLREADQGKRKTLMQEVLNILQDQQRVQSLIVFRGIAGFGDSGEIRASDLLRINVDLPLVIEFFDIPKVVDAALALLDGLVAARHILTWRAELRKPPETGRPKD
jgi:hypothetical protein